jgi:radical SAM-linked protein
MGSRRQRLWLTFGVGGSLRWLGHLDLFRAWERALRRGDLPLLYSQGFNPRPRMAIALPLPLGLTGEGELLDVLLTHPVPPLEIAHRVRPQLPTGLTLRGVEEADLGVPSLQSQLRAAEYIVRLKAMPVDLSQRVQELLAAERWPRQRRGREYDLRPLIRAMSVDWSLVSTEYPPCPGSPGGQPQDVEDRCSDFSRSFPRRTTQIFTTTENAHGQSPEVEQVLVMVLEAGDRGTGRPDEVLLALGVDPQTADTHRRSVRFAFDK